MLSKSWYKIIGLATLQGAISLTWLIYGVYLPKLLVGFGFPAELAVTLLIVESAIGIILEPLFGSLSDRDYRWVATKFGFVSLGVISTSALSILIPTIFVFGDLFRAVSWILPGVLIAWSMAMSIFRTPAISLIGRYAFASELPIAMSFLTLAGSIVGALKPISQNFILSLGAPLAFTIASIVLLAATALLRYFDPPITPNLAVTEDRSIGIINVDLLIGMGWGIAWGFRCLMETIPKIIKMNFPQFDAILLMVVILLAIGVSALPGGIFAAKYGNQRLMLIGIGAILISLLIMVFLPNIITIAIAILLVSCCLSWVTNGAIPLAINMFPIDRAGLAVGLYFGGFTAGICSFNWLFNPVTNLTPVLGAICGSIGFVVAGGCVFSSLELGNRE
jgi:hypothetical protein